MARLRHARVRVSRRYHCDRRVGRVSACTFEGHATRPCAGRHDNCVHNLITVRILIICGNNELPVQGVVLRKKKSGKKLISGVVPFAKMGSAKKNRKKIFFAPAPLCRNTTIVGRMLCLPHCLLPHPPTLLFLRPHSPPCCAVRECIMKQGTHERQVLCEHVGHI